MASPESPRVSVSRKEVAVEDGKPVHEYELSNESLSIKILSYGATLVSVRCPDRHGFLDEVRGCVKYVVVYSFICCCTVGYFVLFHS